MSTLTRALLGVAGVGTVLWALRITVWYLAGWSAPAGQAVAEPALPVEVRTSSGGQTAAFPSLRRECLVNDHGIARKALVVRPNVRPLNRPDGELNGKRLAFFQPYFVFGVSPNEERPEFVELGNSPQRDSVLGWIRIGDVAQWDSRYGATYEPPTFRAPPLVLYERPEALEQLIRDGQTPAKPIARCTTSGANLMPWPIAETRTFVDKGQTHELVRLLFLGEFKPGADLVQVSTGRADTGPTYTREEIDRFRTGLRSLDLVFVVDNTMSTTEFVPQIIETVQRIVRELGPQSSSPDLACGLVLYRDYVDEIMFESTGSKSVTWTLNRGRLMSDLHKFTEEVAKITAAVDGSDGPEEAVFDGVHAALTETSWRDRLSHRVVVLIGDNSGHEPGSPKNPRNLSIDALIKRASEQRAAIFTLAVANQYLSDQEPHRIQFETLARRTGGHSSAIERVDELVGRISRLVQTEAAVIHDRSTIVQALEERTTAELLADPATDIRKVTNVLEFLAGAGIDPDRLGVNIPMFATGWCRAELLGVPLIRRQVYLARPELDRLLGDLNLLCSVMAQKAQDEPGARIQWRLGFTVLNTSAGEDSFFGVSRDETFETYIQARLGIPTTKGILRLTQEEMRSMSELDRARLKERVAREIIPRLVNCRNDDRYFKFVDDTEWGWIPEELLP